MVPLLQLPKEVITHVLRNLNLLEIIVFSLCSKRTRLLIRESKRAISCQSGIKVDLPKEFEIFVYLSGSTFSIIGTCDDLGQLIPTQLSFKVLCFEKTLLELANPDFGVRDWIDHLVWIFSQRTIDMSFSRLDHSKYTPESVHDVLKGLHIERLALGDANTQEVCKILKLFPVMDFLLMENIAEPEISNANVQFLRRVLMGNLTYVKLRHTVPLDLDFLLSINSRNIFSHAPKLSDKHLNVFLRLWIRGSNLNLERMQLQYSYMPRNRHGRRRTFDEGAIFKGINHEMKPGVQHFHPKGGHGWYRFSDAIDIRRSDGTVASIKIDYEIMRFNMFVWSSEQVMREDL